MKAKKIGFGILMFLAALGFILCAFSCNEPSERIKILEQRRDSCHRYVELLKDTLIMKQEELLHK